MQNQQMGNKFIIRRLWRWTLMIVTLIFVPACTAQQYGGREAVASVVVNPLAFAANPYLQKFATSSVYWYPWNAETLAASRVENKLLAIDIGTTACYACLLQDRLVYQDSAVIQLMNDAYISLRIDRLERPDLAKRYLMLLDNQSSGGWPLQVIALPDGRPLAVGNFLTPESWAAELRRQSALWQTNPGLCEQVAGRNWEQLQRSLAPPVQASLLVPSTRSVAEAISLKLDLQYGGMPGTPKFPITQPYLFLLRQHQTDPDPRCVAISRQYLLQLLQGGIYDHLGEGIMRCADDPNWRVPCFEKTLYDNALLLRLLAAQQAIDPDPRWEAAMYGIMEFLERDLRLSDHQYAAALRPDSEGELGRYYLWPEIEVRAALGDDASPFIHTYNIRRTGNWPKGQNVLYRTLTDRELAAGYGMNLAEWEGKLYEWRKTMLEARQRRVRPAQDPLQITGWQSLLVSAAVDCYLVLKDDDWLHYALSTADQIQLNVLRTDGSLYHVVTHDIPEGDAFLSDYAYTLEAFIKLYQVTMEEKWVNSAGAMIQYLLAYHFLPESGWFVSPPPSLRDWLRQYDLQDEIMPSGQAILGEQLWRYSWLKDKPMYREIVRTQVALMAPRMLESPIYNCSWSMLAADMEPPTLLVSFAGEAGKSFAQEWLPKSPPQVIFRPLAQENTRSLTGGEVVASIQVGIGSPVDFYDKGTAVAHLMKLLGK